jgi:nitrite reductase/ring-hydroxylating ferredoxin subunit
MSAEDWRERPNAPAAGTPLAALDEVPADNGLERVFGEGPRAFRVVLFKVEAGVRAYVNECPHVRIPYHFSSDVFCDGHCYDGPCKGERLLAVDVAVEDGAVRIA